jgi:hypothetical protein
VHRTVVVFDIEGFGDPCRTNRHQIVVRDGLYRTLERAFDRAHIRWSKCYHEDRGDGVFVLAPAEIPKSLFVDVLPKELADALDEHNRSHCPEERIRLRMALHAGEISYDHHGVTAAAITLAFRLVNAPSLRTALAESPGELALITSPWFFDEVVRNSATGSVASYRPTEVVMKETRTVGWIRTCAGSLAPVELPRRPAVHHAFQHAQGERTAAQQDIVEGADVERPA